MSKNKKLTFNPSEEIQDENMVMDANEQPEYEMLDNTQGAEAAASDDIAGEYQKYKAEAEAISNTIPQANATATTPSAEAAPSLESKITATTPQYSSQWNAELDSLMGQIMNREPFSYDINGDAMYHQYEDIYTRGAEAAMQNAMGQAAALTGGYGSSYGQTAGQQAYAQQMQGLYDVVPELEAQAYARYMAEGDALNQRYAMVADREAQDYQRFLDERSQDNWEKSFNYQQSRDEVADRQWQDSFEYQQSQDAQDQANWEASFEYQQSQDQQAQDNWQASFDREGEQWEAIYGEGGINNPTFEGNFMYDADGNLREGFTTTNTSFFDENGNFKKATFSRTDENGNAVWIIDGKEVVRQPGANPYTGSINPDVKNGTFSNGYQPNNINGEKLSKTGLTDTINGVEQNVWKTPDGSMWIWDGTQNKYLPYVDTEEEETVTDPPANKGGTGGGGGGRPAKGPFAPTIVIK